MASTLACIPHQHCYSLVVQLTDHDWLHTIAPALAVGCMDASCCSSCWRCQQLPHPRQCHNKRTANSRWLQHNPAHRQVTHSSHQQHMF